MEKIDLASINEAINEYAELVQTYFRRLNQNEKIGWILNGTGVVLIIIGLIVW